MSLVINSDFGSKFGFYGGPLQPESDLDGLKITNALTALSWAPIIGGLASGITRIALKVIEYKDGDESPKEFLSHSSIRAELARAVVELIPGSCLILIPVDIAFSIGRCFCAPEEQGS